MRTAALDGDADQLKMLRQTMESIGHECDGFQGVESLVAALRGQKHDLLVIELKMPSLEGLRNLARIRTEVGSTLPILGVSHSQSVQDMIDALGAGADDFMAKPLRVAEFKARVHALLRRSCPNLVASVLNFGPYRFFLSTRTLHLRGQPIDLKMREYDLALFLFRNLDRLLAREHLQDAVWGNEIEGPTRSLDTHLSRLRTKLQLRPSNGVLLSAIYGMGYRLEFIDSGAFASTSSLDGEAPVYSTHTQGVT